MDEVKEKLEKLDKDLDDFNWYLKLERCHVCKQSFSEGDVKDWANKISTVSVGPTRFAHRTCPK